MESTKVIASSVKARQRLNSRGMDALCWMMRLLSWIRATTADLSFVPQEAQLQAIQPASGNDAQQG
jgi:hypothetical protein